MKYLKKATLFAVKKENTCAGVFSSREKAEEMNYDLIEEIIPEWMEGTPDSGKYICMGAGCQTVLIRKGEGFDSQIYDIGPVWGANVQTVCGLLFADGLRTRGLHTSGFFIYEIDKDYSDQLPEDLSQRFKDVAGEMFWEGEERSAQAMEKDYIAAYFEDKSWQAEIDKRKNSEAMKLLMDQIMETAYQNKLFRSKHRYASYERLIRSRLARAFSLEELRQLAASFNLMDDAVISAQMEDGSISAGKIQEMKERFAACVDVSREPKE